MVATQHLDQRTRRVLHDEVLPLIHTGMLMLATGADKDAVALHQLSDAHQQVSNLLRELPSTTTPDVARLGLLPALRKMIDVEFAAAFDAIEVALPASRAGRSRWNSARSLPTRCITLPARWCATPPSDRGQPDPRRNCACCSLQPSRTGNLD